MAQIEFYFTFIVNGSAELAFTWSGKKGTADEKQLVLDGQTLSIGDIVDTTTREERLLMVLRETARIPEELRPRVSKDNVIVLNINSGSTAVQIEEHLDRYSSAFAAEAHRKELEAAGRGSEFKALTCPNCSATIDVSGLDSTPFVYCRFCESVIKEAGGLASDGRVYRLCDECDFFGRVQQYTIFYFYFLLVVYGWRVQRRHLCDSCARPTLLKALFINLIFILGVPVALWGLIKSYLGGDPTYASLPAANKLARAGDFASADPLYKKHMTAGNVHPGIAMNRGLGHLFGSDVNGAVQCFGEALDACGNYLPVIRLVRKLQSSAGGPAQG